MFLACAVWYVLSIIKTRKWKNASGEVVQCWTTGTEVYSRRQGDSLLRDRSGNEDEEESESRWKMSIMSTFKVLGFEAV